MKCHHALLAVSLCLFAVLPLHAQQPVQPPRIPDIVYIPTPHDVAAKMLDLAAVTKQDVVYDLGCGDGRILVAAASRYGCRAVGVDIDPLRIEEAEKNVKDNKVDKLVAIRQQDLFEVDLREATVVILYLHPKYNVRLIPQLKTMKPGSRIVSHQFDMPGVKPDKVVRMKSSEDGHEHVLFLWTTPLGVRD